MYEHYLFGVPVYSNPQLTETEEYDVEVKLTLKQRWIEPLLNWRTMPFEPWIKTKKEKRVRTVPSKKLIQTDFGLFAHPEHIKEIVRIVNYNTY